MVEALRGDRRGPVPDGAISLLDRAFYRMSLAVLRRELADCGAAHGLVDIALANFVLAVDEIVTNAVQYAGGRGDLLLWRDGDSLWCRVADNGPGLPERYLHRSPPPRPGHIGSHGLWLARHICESVHIESDRTSGTRVLLRYRLPNSGR
jgi:anti-sigma regulatory factor (Ser/Thr protein kinase)